MSYDRPDVFSASVFPGETTDDTHNEITKAFRTFLLEFRLDEKFVYRDQIRENLLVNHYYLTVNSDHLIAMNEELHKKLTDDPAEIIPLFEKAITEIAKRIAYLSSDKLANEIPQCQLILSSNANRTMIRDLDSVHISKIVRVSGIIISTSVLSSRATLVQLICRNCKHTTRLQISLGFGQVNLPKKCLGNEEALENRNKCPPDPYVIVHDKSTFIDQQVLKLQESPDMVPVGEMPRHILMQADRYLTNQVVPGTRVTVVGIYSIYQSKKQPGSSTGVGNTVAIRNPYLKVLGIKTDIEQGLNGEGISFTDEEEEQFRQVSRIPNLYEKLAHSIAPSIYGNDDIKKAIVCLLFGGSKKILPDGMRLRGDINVLLLGDPGTAKSQLLKFVEKASPIAVYTSGKGSSAAGLTASVQRDPQTRDFYLEGGAMVLADGGVVCIDEFDKMRDEDRVAIHEAMEQQTISIAKAGITTVLNSRTSVLAAANPIYGRYDETKSPGENIDFQTTILSRFDMIFIVKDDHNEQRDMNIAHHVLNIHTGKQQNQDETETGEIPLDFLKKYVQYTKLRCAPRLSAEASERLSSHFVGIRRKLLHSEQNSKERLSIPITVRQLEAIIRITELLAKMRLDIVATEEDVEEAIRLFTASTMDAVDQGITGYRNQDFMKQLDHLEREIGSRFPKGWTAKHSVLRSEFVQNKGYSDELFDAVLTIMERRGEIRFLNQRRQIRRLM